MTLITLGCEDDQPLFQPPLLPQGFELQPLLPLLIQGLELQPLPPLPTQGLEPQPLLRMMPAEQQAMRALSTINSFILLGVILSLYSICEYLLCG